MIINQTFPFFPTQGVIRVHIIEAANLIEADPKFMGLGGGSDPFTIVSGTSHNSCRLCSLSTIFIHFKNHNTSIIYDLNVNNSCMGLFITGIAF